MQSVKKNCCKFVSIVIMFKIITFGKYWENKWIVQNESTWKGVNLNTHAACCQYFTSPCCKQSSVICLSRFPTDHRWNEIACIYYQLVISPLIHLSDVFEVKFKIQKSGFYVTYGLNFVEFVGVNEGVQNIYLTPKPCIPHCWLLSTNC